MTAENDDLKRWYVIDIATNSTSWNENTGGQYFLSEVEARKLAEEMAISAPGESFLVCVSIRAVIAHVGPPTVTEI